MTTVTRLSDVYLQLYKLFESLENARFVSGTDFGENLTGCFQWFISPASVAFLEKRNDDFWNSLKGNPKIIYRLEPWDRHKGLGANISLK